MADPEQKKTSKSSPAPTTAPYPDPLRERLYLDDKAAPMILKDPKTGRPLVENYWPAGTKPEERVIRVSIATQPPKFLEQDDPRAAFFYTQFGLEDKPRIPNEDFIAPPLPIKKKRDFNAINAGQEAAVRETLDAFEKQIGGVRFEVVRDDPNADLTVMGYTGRGYGISGFSSLPPLTKPEKDSFGHLRKGLIAINQEHPDVQAYDKKTPFVNTFTHELGHFMGLLHPEDAKVRLHPLQYRALSLMESGSYTKPVIDDTHWAALDIIALEQSLKGTPQPLHSGNDRYDTIRMSVEQSLNVRSTLFPALKPEKARELRFVENALGGYNPHALHIRDGGGKDDRIAITGDGNFLDTNQGFASQINGRDQKFAQLLTLLKGHMEVVEIDSDFLTGSGNQIITAEGKQQRLPGEGGYQKIVTTSTEKAPTKNRNDIALLYRDIGTVIVDSAHSHDTVTLSADLLRGAKIKAAQQGNDIVLTFDYPQDKSIPTGTLTLTGQATQNSGGKGIEAVRVVGRDGAPIFHANVTALATAEDWQRSVITPLEVMEQAARAGKPIKPLYETRKDYLSSEEYHNLPTPPSPSSLLRLQPPTEKKR